MVDTTVGRGLVRMTIQAMSRVGAQGYGINDLLSRAVMASGTGAGPVGRNIVFNAFNFRPVGHDMAAAAGSPVRKVARTQSNGMEMRTMTDHLISVAGGTGDLGSVQSLLNGLPDSPGIKKGPCVIMAEGTVGTVQSVNVSSICQGAATRSAEHRGVAGMAGAA